jgi:regulatory protein
MSNAAITKLMDYLARRSHSERELRDKLSEKFTEQEVEDALTYAQEQNWLEDPVELSQRVSAQLHQKNKGHLYISHYLQKKGLPPVDRQPELEYKKAQDIAEAYQDLNREKLARKLHSRGFDNETIWQVLK